MKHIGGILVFLTMAGCFSEPGRLSEMEAYTGPLSESENIVILVSDSSVIKLEMRGAKQLAHQNGDLEFPDGIQIFFYDIHGQKTSELQAQQGYFIKKENIYRANGDVYVNNLNKKETLSTEELFWNPKTEKIHTDKFVTIETEDQLILAEGLDAPQDFSTYTIRKPRESIFKIREGHENNY